MSAAAKHPIRLTVNGQARERQVEPRLLLSDFLRQDLGLTGTHVGCEHGVCGACTVLVDGEPVRSCLMLAVQADGHEITTVESLAGRDGSLHPLQQAFWEAHALQCGFCTPGFPHDPVAVPGGKSEPHGAGGPAGHLREICAAAPAISTSSMRCSWRRRGCGRRGDGRLAGRRPARSGE